jgi:hypothetical protein
MDETVKEKHGEVIRKVKERERRGKNRAINFGTACTSDPTPTPPDIGSRPRIYTIDFRCGDSPYTRGRGVRLLTRTAQCVSALGLCNDTGPSADVRNRRLPKPTVWTAVSYPQDI